jgi:hypothetical protein
MTARDQRGFRSEFYRARVGEPTTHDAVRGYWVFLTGLVSGTLGIVLFIPSTAPRATSFTLREATILVAAVGSVTRLPLRP